MLPDSKGGFPKFLYLDTCKWIDLSRAHYRSPEGEPFQAALAAVQAAVASGNLVVPFSAVNALEAAKHGEPGRRNRLFKFMVRLSRGNAVLPLATTLGWEMKNALRRIFARGKAISVRYSLIGPGVGHALGKSLRVEAETPEIEAAIMREALSLRETLRGLRGLGKDRSVAERMKAVEEDALAMFERIRAWSTSELNAFQQREFMLAETLTKGEEGRAFKEALKEVHVTTAELRRLLTCPKMLESFVGLVPALDVPLTLSIARDQNHDHKIKLNDIRDFGWLAVALPYANLVVSEKAWHGMACANRLDQRYGTTMIRDARELPRRLTELGCI